MDDGPSSPPATKKSRTGASDEAKVDHREEGGGSAKFNLAQLVMAHAGGDMSRLSSEQLELLCPGMPANVARVLIPILANKGRKEREQEQRQSDRTPPGAPGYDANMVVTPYRKEGYDRSPFGTGLAHPPEVVVRKILGMLSIGDVFACYRTSRAWVNDAVTAMAAKSKAVEERFACKCVGLQPKIMGRYVDLSAVTHAGGTEVHSWSNDPMDQCHWHRANLEVLYVNENPLGEQNMFFLTFLSSRYILDLYLGAILVAKKVSVSVIPIHRINVECETSFLSTLHQNFRFFIKVARDII